MTCSKHANTLVTMAPHTPRTVCNRAYNQPAVGWLCQHRVCTRATRTVLGQTSATGIATRACDCAAHLKRGDRPTRGTCNARSCCPLKWFGSKCIADSPLTTRTSMVVRARRPIAWPCRPPDPCRNVHTARACHRTSPTQTAHRALRRGGSQTRSACHAALQKIERGLANEPAGWCRALPTQLPPRRGWPPG